MTKPQLPLDDLYQGHILNFAHRGARMDAPENTLPAFARAAELGADGIELDVQLTSDGVPVVFHDFQLTKTSNGTGRLQDYPLEALRKLDAGSYFSEAFAGTQIPTLEEVFDAVSDLLHINIELKYFGRDPGTIRALVSSVSQLIRDRDLQRRIILSSFNPLVLREVRQSTSELAIGYLVEPATPLPLKVDWVARLLIGRFEAQHPHHSMVDASSVQRLHERGYRVNVWTVNEPEAIRRMCDFGVDMIMSDYPDRVRDVLEEFRASGTSAVGFEEQIHG